MTVANPALLTSVGMNADRALLTKRDRIPPGHQDWLAGLCSLRTVPVVADGLFPRLPPVARTAAMLALLAAEANGDGYVVGRDPLTGALQTLPPPAASVVLDPQRFRLYLFASEDPLTLTGEWRSVKVWSLRWQAGPFLVRPIPWLVASWPSAHVPDRYEQRVCSVRGSVGGLV